MLELILIILAIFAIAGASVYFFVDISKHKDANKADFTQVDKNLTTEKEDRLANLKFIVEQVNKTNKDMDTAYNKKFDEQGATLVSQQAKLEGAIDKYNRFESGFGTIIRPTGAVVAGQTQGVQIPITSLSTVPATNVDLIKHVSAMGGLTIKDLVNSAEAPEMRVKICGAGNPAKCMELPNSDGDVYLTSLVNDKSIIVDAPMQTKGLLKTYGTFELYPANSTTKVGAFGATPDNHLSMTAPEGISIYTGENTAPALTIDATNNLAITGNVLLNNTTLADLVKQEVQSQLAAATPAPAPAPTTTTPVVPPVPTAPVIPVSA